MIVKLFIMVKLLRHAYGVQSLTYAIAPNTGSIDDYN